MIRDPERDARGILLAKVQRAVEAIDGPWRRTEAALRAIEALSDALFTDPPIGLCESCGRPVWPGDSGTAYVGIDRELACGDCADAVLEVRAQLFPGAAP